MDVVAAGAPKQSLKRSFFNVISLFLLKDLTEFESI